MKIAIIGAGAGGQAAALNLTAAGHKVDLYKRGGDKDGGGIFTVLIDKTHDTLASGHIPTVFYELDNPDSLRSLGAMDAVLLALPVHACAGVCRAIKSHIPSHKPFYVGSIFGQGFLNTFLKGDLGLYSDLQNVETFSMAYIPWIVKSPSTNVVKATSFEHFNLYYSTDKGNSTVEDIVESLTSLNPYTTKLVETDTELEVALTSDNWLLHTPRLHGLLTQQLCKHRGDLIPQFYGDYSNADFRILYNINREFENMKKALSKYVKESHGVEIKHLYTFAELEEMPDIQGNTSPFLGFENYFATDTTKGFCMRHTINSEGNWELDMSHRMFPDDVMNGLAIIHALCTKLNVKCMYLAQLYLSLLTSMRDSGLYPDLESQRLLDWDNMDLDSFLMGVDETCLTS